MTRLHAHAQNARTLLAIKAQAAYAQLCEQFNADFVYVLNTEAENLSFERLSEMLSKLFYQLECSEYTYEKREKYRKVCRIERIVAIEQGQKFHAHILVKRFGNLSEQVITERLITAWRELNNSNANTANDYLVQRIDSTIRDNKAVCAYNTKDIARQIISHKDVIDLKSSFIRKHSNRQ